jgi:midasin
VAAGHGAPILLQGPTSAGKTTLVEYLAARTGHACVRINNHEHTDVAEYIGQYTADPQTGRLRFVDGLLVRALREGRW